MISPAKTAADSRYWRSIKYSLFPPLGLATLAGYLDPDDEVDLQDEHVETLRLDDEPDLVVIEAYITSARRAYRYADHYRARGAYVCLGGLHPTSLPDEAARHADSVFCGPGEDTWPAFLRDFRAGRPQPLYRSTERTLAGLPPARRDLIKRERYLVPNSLVVSRGCPHVCDFCYKEAFFRGGRSFYVQAVDDALAEIDRLPGRHLYFLDDNLFGSPPFAEALFDGLQGHGPPVAGGRDGARASCGRACSRRRSRAGCAASSSASRRSSEANLRGAGKTQNLAGDGAGGGAAQPQAAVRRRRPPPPRPRRDGQRRASSSAWTTTTRRCLARTVEWAVSQGIETATFHILTPYPGTRAGAAARGRGPHHEPRLGPATTRATPCSRRRGMTRGAARGRLLGRVPRLLPLAQHPATAAFAPRRRCASTRATSPTPAAGRSSSRCGTWAIRSGQVHRFLPLLETILDRFGSGGGAMPGRLRAAGRRSSHGCRPAPQRWTSGRTAESRTPRPQGRMPSRSSSAGAPIRLRYPSTTFSGSIVSNISLSRWSRRRQPGGEGQVLHRDVLDVEPLAERTLGVQVAEDGLRHADPLAVPVMNRLDKCPAASSRAPVNAAEDFGHLALLGVGTGVDEQATAQRLEPRRVADGPHVDRDGVVAGELVREQHELVLVAEVPLQDAARPVGLLGDVADRGVLQAAVRDGAPHGLGELRPALLPVDHLATLHRAPPVPDSGTILLDLLELVPPAPSAAAPAAAASSAASAYCDR